MSGLSTNQKTPTTRPYTNGYAGGPAPFLSAPLKICEQNISLTGVYHSLEESNRLEISTADKFRHPLRTLGLHMRMRRLKRIADKWWKVKHQIGLYEAFRVDGARRAFLYKKYSPQKLEKLRRKFWR